MIRDAHLLEAPESHDADPQAPPSRTPGVPRPLVTASELAWRGLVCAAGIALCAFILWKLRLILLPVVIALLLATVLMPGVRRLQAMGAGRTGATAWVFCLALGAVVLVAAIVIPSMVGEFDDLAEQVRAGADDLGRRVADIGLASQREVQDAIAHVDDRLRDNAARIGSGALSAGLVVGQLLAGTVLTLVLLFFFLKDGERLWSWVVRLFPRDARPAVEAVGETGWRVLGGYVRGVAATATFDSVFIAIGLAVLGVPLVLPLALLTFVAAFVPIVGAYVAGAASVLVALVAQGPVTALIVVGLIVLVQQLEGNLMYPVVVGRTVKIHPVAILLAVGAGGVIAGIIGAFIAVPLAAVISTAIPAAREAMREAGPGVSAAAAGERGADRFTTAP